MGWAWPKTADGDLQSLGSTVDAVGDPEPDDSGEESDGWHIPEADGW